MPTEGATPARRGPARKKARGAKAAGLSRDTILQAALALVAEDGLAALSTRRIGERLGCEAMSIYHHYPGKQHLLDAMVDHAIGSIECRPKTCRPSIACASRCTPTGRWRTGFRRSFRWWPCIA